MPDGTWVVVAIYVALCLYMLWDLRHAKLLEQCTLDLLEARCEINRLREKLKKYEGKDKTNDE